MKNIIMYKYNIYIDDIKKEKNKYYIKSKRKYYCFERTVLDQKSLELINDSNMFYKILINIEGQLFTIINREKYILYEIKATKNIIVNQQKIINKSLNKDWGTIWQKKIDFISIQSINIELKEYIDYYIGLGECAISEWNKINKEEIEYSICRKRMNKDINNPNNAVIDVRERDLAEYIKENFFYNNDIDIKYLMDIFINKGFNPNIIYSRLLFPTYYFDLVEDSIINGNSHDYKIKNIIMKRKEYERMLNTVYTNYIKKT